MVLGLRLGANSRAGRLGGPLISALPAVQAVNGDNKLGYNKVLTCCAGPRATHEEFLENLHTASHSLKDTLPRVLEFISGKTLKDL